jgi:hypothetical protein
MKPILTMKKTLMIRMFQRPSLTEENNHCGCFHIIVADGIALVSKSMENIGLEWTPTHTGMER